MSPSAEPVLAKPLSVSVIIPAHNRLPVLERAFLSVRHQTYPIDQLILVDDGSTDGTSSWVSANRSDIRLVQLAKNRGAGAARNAGLLVADSDVVAFLDSDDVWLPTYISKQVDAMVSNGCAKFGYCSKYVSASDLFSLPVSCTPVDEDDLLKSMLLCPFIHTMSQVVVRRSAFDEIGTFNEQLPMCEDWELYLRLLPLGRPACVDEELVIKNWQADSCAFRDDGAAWLRGFYRALDAFYATSQGKPYADLRSAIENSIRRLVGKNLLLFRTCVLEERGAGMA